MPSDWNTRVDRLATTFLTRQAAAREATFWCEVKTITNLTVKDYEDPNMGESALSGVFHLVGVLHVKPKGAIWDAPFPVKARVAISQHASSGTTVFSVQGDDPLSRLLDMALLDDMLTDVIIHHLGKVEFVPSSRKFGASGLSKVQVQNLMKKFGIPGVVTGTGAAWEVELPNEAAKTKFQKNVTKDVGGYKTGYGGWVLKPGYQDTGDWNDPSSQWHY